MKYRKAEERMLVKLVQQQICNYHKYWCNSEEERQCSGLD